MPARTNVTIQRFAGTIVKTSTVVEVNDAEIDFEEILDACEVVGDDEYRIPWEYCDGYEHTLEKTYGDSRMSDARGYTYAKDAIVVLDPKIERDAYTFFRKSGHSKQVSRELAALDRRRAVDQLVKWYNDGWEYYGVRCEYLDAQASCWGFDDYDYALTERESIADEVAFELEGQGYTIVNRPEPERHVGKTNLTRDEYRAMLKRKLRGDCWTD